MDELNYHHLLYFWVVASEGSIARACERLQLAQPTISAQLRKLERSLGEKLFDRVGRNLALTETGQMVFRYADEIFSIGREMVDVVKGQPTGRPLRLVVGVFEMVPKLVCYRLLEPAFHMPEPVHVMCREGKLDELLADLALHRFDVVLSDSPAGPNIKVKVFNHQLGDCDISIFAVADLANRFRRRFPQSLDGAPFLLPTENTALRRSLDQWFESQQLRPLIVGEFDDSALLKEFGKAGVGLFPASTAIEKEVQQQYHVRAVGRIEAVRERFYAITVERKLKHPAVVAISRAARQDILKAKV